jgi:hypothetical protein
MDRSDTHSEDGATAPWRRLADSLPEAERSGPTRALLEALVSRAFRHAGSAAGRRELVPSSVQAGPPDVVFAHLTREAGREILRRRYSLADTGLADPAAVVTVSTGETAFPSEVPLTEVGPRLYAGPLVAADWCARLAAEVSLCRRWMDAEGLPPLAPNSMNRYGLMLEDLGLQAALDGLVCDVVRPFAATLYPDLGGATLQEHHGFVVEYERGGDIDLGFHVDDADVTLNVCLGETFSGGDLRLRGLRCEQHLQDGWRPEEDVSIAHVPGQALLHAGKHRHEALAIASGRRVNLIVWCRSPAFREAEAQRVRCPAWCDHA